MNLLAKISKYLKIPVLLLASATADVEFVFLGEKKFVISSLLFSKIRKKYFTSDFVSFTICLSEQT